MNENVCSWHEISDHRLIKYRKFSLIIIVNIMLFVNGGLSHYINEFIDEIPLTKILHGYDKYYESITIAFWCIIYNMLQCKEHKFVNDATLHSKIPIYQRFIMLVNEKKNKQI